MAAIFTVRPSLQLSPALGRSLPRPLPPLPRRRDARGLPPGLGTRPFLRTARWGNARADFSRGRGPGPAHCSVPPSHPLLETPLLERPEPFTLVYRFPGITYCRLLSRMKLLQTGVTLLALPPVCHLYMHEQVSQEVLLYVTGIACFAAAMLYGISYFLRRMIGLIYLNEAGTIVKVAHLTFWGRKKVIYCPIETVMTLGDTGDGVNELLLQFKQYNTTQVLYFTLKFGHIVDKQRFTQIFGEFY